MADIKYYLSEKEIEESFAYKDFTKLIMTNGSVLSSRVVDNTLFEFAKVCDGGRTFILTTVNNKMWSLAINFPSTNNTIYAFNKDIVEELLNG